jgi:hypothetical protein
MSTLYNADIVETAARNGIFRATLRGSAPIAMVSAGLPDGSIQFWRGSTPSLLYRSVHRTAGYRVELGAGFPYRLVRRREGWPETPSKPCAGVAQNRETLAGTSRVHPTLPPVPESPRPICEVAL